MESSHHSTTHRSPKVHKPHLTEVETRTSNKCSYLLAALAVISLIGSLVAAGLLYSHIGYYSLAAVGFGLFVSALLMGSAVCCFSRQTTTTYRPLPGKSMPKKRGEDPYQYRQEVFEDTQDACLRGYDHNDTHVKIEHTKMLDNTVTYVDPPALSALSQKYVTQFSVIIDDTLNVLLRLKQQGVANPVANNMANAHHPGGGVKRGCPAQEEAICRRTNHFWGLETQEYPLPETGGVYCPHVQIFKLDQEHDFAYMEKPEEVALVAAAALDLRPTHFSARRRCNLPLHGPITEEMLMNNETYKTTTKKIIRNMLRTMAANGHTHIVLGALGCGAFENQPKVVAQLFYEVLRDKEFQGRFEQVHFAILKLTENDQHNIDAFTEVCERLNHPDPDPSTSSFSALSKSIGALSRSIGALSRSIGKFLLPSRFSQSN